MPPQNARRATNPASASTTVIVRAAEATKILVRLDRRDAVKEVTRVARDDGVASISSVGCEGWLASDELLLALSSGTDQLPPALGTDCYMPLRGQEVFYDPSIWLGSVRVGQLLDVGIFSVANSGQVITVPGTLLLTYRRRHAAPAGPGDSHLMFGTEVRSLSVNSCPVSWAGCTPT